MKQSLKIPAIPTIVKLLTGNCVSQVKLMVLENKNLHKILKNRRAQNYPISSRA
jgi:hypothetical protein